MKLKRFLSLAVALAMVLSIVPAMSLTASAAIGDTIVVDGVAYVIDSENLVANGTFEENTNGWISWDGTNKLGSFSRSTNQAHSGSYSLKSDDNGGGTSSASLVGQFDLPADVQSGDKFVLSVWSYSNNDGITLTMGLGADKSTAQIDISCGGLGNSDKETPSCNLKGLPTNQWRQHIYLLTAKAESTYAEIYARWLGTGTYFDDAELYKVVESSTSTVDSVKGALDVISVPRSAKGKVALPATTADSVGTEVNVTWRSDNSAVAEDGTYTGEEIVTVAFTPSTVFEGETVTGATKNVVVFPASRAGSVYDSGAGIFTIGTENIISANGTAASFEDAAGERVLTGWESHLGGETNGAMDWVDANIDVVPDGNWAYAGWWNDPITHNSNYCTIDTMWPVKAGKHYLSFYAKKPAGGSTTYVYYSTDNAHHRDEASLTSEAWYSLVSPGSDWAKYEYIIEATEAGYIGFTSYNIGNNGSRGTQFDDFELYTAEMAATSVEVVATYTAGGEQVDTATLVYDTTKGEENVIFPELYYATNGSNTIYHAPATTLAESATIEMTAVENNGDLEIGYVFANAGEQYEIKSANLIPNGDFSLGLTGWYVGDGNPAASANFRVNEDGTVTKINGTGNQNKEGSIYRAWKVEPNKTYVYTYTSTQGSIYHKNSLGETFDATGSDGSRILFEGAAGTNTKVFTTSESENYLIASYRWLGNNSDTFGNFGLYEIAPATVIVKEEIASVANIDKVTVFGNEAVVLPATVKVTGTLGSNVDGTIAWEAPATYPAGETTTVNGTVTVKFSETAEAITEAVSVDVTVVDKFTLPDTESAGAQPGEVVYFPMAISGEFTMEFDYTINEVADASIQMGYNGARFGDAALGISPNGYALNATGANKESVELVKPVAAGETYHMVLTMDASDDTYTLVVETADGSVVTTGEKGFRKAQDAINTMTVLLNGNNFNNKGTLFISNINVTAAPVEFCTVTVDGEAKQVIKGRAYKKALTGAALVDADGNIYAPVDGFVTVPVNGDITLATKALGLEMVGGAQVRIGNTKLDDGAKLDALADSGLRFLAQANYTDTLAAIADEFGIKVTAEDSSNAAYVPAVNFQNDDNTVFSAAITNLKENNYNRKYTAVAYAKIGDVEVTSAPVTRSIYQVSAGIMKNGAADTEDAYTVDDVVKNILNAYVNQTGIRLTVTTDGVTVEDGKYTGDVFFTVESVSDGDDGFNVTITPDTSWNTPAEIAEWWTDYVRFNNNNSVAKGYISANYYIDNEPVFIHADGSLTFNFDTTDDGTGGFDGPWIPIQPTDK